MDCREAQELLNAFHDGELPTGTRARVEEHLRGCPECRALLADLARSDQAVGVPDPGPAYWDRFNARVIDRVDRDRGGPAAAVLRPKHGWMRQQLRYLVPAAAAAALVVMVVRYGGMSPDLSPRPMARDGQVSGQAGTPPVLEPRPMARDGQVPGQAGMQPGVSTKARDGQVSGQAGTPRVLKPRPARDGQVPGQAGTPPVLEPRPMARDGQVPGQAGTPPVLEPRPHVPASDGMSPGMLAERKKMEAPTDGQGRPSVGAGRDAPGFEAPTGKAESASGMRMAKESSQTSPCELARTLAEGERIREAETAQRACLAGGLSAPSREKGLVFLAELLDRQARFAEADAVIAEVDRRFPQSHPLDLYRQQRPKVQKQPMAVPVTR